MRELTHDQMAIQHHRKASAEYLAQRDNLAMMLRRMIWMANKETGDTSMKVLAGKATELIEGMGLNGSPVRDGNWIADVFTPLPEEEAALLRDYGV